MTMLFKFSTEIQYRLNSVICAIIVFLGFLFDDVKIRAGSKIISININSRTFFDIVSRYNGFNQDRSFNQENFGTKFIATFFIKVFSNLVAFIDF